MSDTCIIVAATMFIVSFQSVIIGKKIYDKYKAGQINEVAESIKKQLFSYSNYYTNVKARMVNTHTQCSCCDEKIKLTEPHAICNNSMFNQSDQQHIYCKDCINSYVAVAIGQNKYELRCMEHPNGCEFVFEQDYIRNLLNPDNLKRFNEIILIEKVEKKAAEIPNYQICPKCKMSGYVANNVDQYCFCDKCGFCWCKKCKYEFHSNNPCGVFSKCTDEYKIRNFMKEVMTDTLAHKCFNCGLIYDKVEGCHHITCPKCKSEWCFVCRTAYKSGKKMCKCDKFKGKPEYEKFQKNTRENLKKVILANTDEKVKSVMIDEVEKQGYYMPYAVTGDIWKSLKHTFFG